MQRSDDYGYCIGVTRDGDVTARRLKPSLVFGSLREVPVLVRMGIHVVMGSNMAMDDAAGVVGRRMRVIRVQVYKRRRHRAELHGKADKEHEPQTLHLGGFSPSWPTPSRKPTAIGRAGTAGATVREPTRPPPPAVPAASTISP